MMKRFAPVASLVTLAVLSSTTGCDKIKSLAGGGDGGQSGGGGILASMFGSDFEGEITMQATARNNGTQGPTTLVFGIKRPKYRVDASGGFAAQNPTMGSSLILDPPTKKGYALVPAKKQAIVLDFEKMKGLAKNMPVRPGLGKPDVGTPKAPPSVEKTGKKDTVAGYTCEEWKITSGGRKTADACVAEGITWFDLSDLGWSSPEMSLAALATDANRFPLRLVTFDEAGVEETRLEAQKIDKKKLDDARFTVPPDYAVVDIAAMLGGMGLPGAQPGAPGAQPTFQLPKGLPTAPPRR